MSLAVTYFRLTKPGIIFGNAITAVAGFALASRSSFNIPQFLLMLLGLSLIIGSACVFNNYLDRSSDEKMARTSKRALVTGEIPLNHALVFGSVLLGLDSLSLALINLLTLSIALFGFIGYVFIYTSWKYRTVYGTIIGSVAGAVPPVVGYCAVSNHLDAAALILFLILVCWQMPHFYAIAIYRLEDYQAASIPVWPLVKGIRSTKWQIRFYILAFLIISCLPTFYGFTGNLYLRGSVILGVFWLVLTFSKREDKPWARQVFLFSLIVITLQSILISVDVIK